MLGDPEKRANYDRFGVDSESANQRTGFHPGFGGFGGFGGEGFQGEISPEDLLRMFMGGGLGGGMGHTFSNSNLIKALMQVHSFGEGAILDRGNTIRPKKTMATP